MFNIYSFIAENLEAIFIFPFFSRNRKLRISLDICWLRTTNIQRTTTIFGQCKKMCWVVMFNIYSFLSISHKIVPFTENQSPTIRDHIFPFPIVIFSHTSSSSPSSFLYDFSLVALTTKTQISKQPFQSTHGAAFASLIPLNGGCSYNNKTNNNLCLPSAVFIAQVL